EGGKGIGKGSGIDKKIKSRFDKLDDIYKARAQQIVLAYISKNNNITTNIIDHLGKGRIEPDQPFAIDDVDWASSMPITTKNGTDLWLYENELPLISTESGISTVGGIYDICFIVDSSGSMSWNPEHGTGEYDLLLRTIYSIFQFLEDTGKAQYLNYACINFSDVTRFTGWHDYYNIDNVKKELFRHQNGGTTLNPNQINNLVTQSSDKFLAIMVSDGGISNTDSSIIAVKELMKAGNDYTLIQIGSHSTFSQSLKSSKADVKKISSPNDLVGLILKKTKQAYGGV
ncbi:VWA domain-containing protein, partial [Nanoarchaeota archaeon]